MQVDTLAVHPGKPQGWGHLPRPDGSAALLLALPGNPVAVFTSFHLFVAPVLGALACRPARPRGRRVLAGEAFRGRPGGLAVQPVALVADEQGRERAVARAAGIGAGSHQVASLHRADALALVEHDLAAGEEVTVIPTR